MDKYRYQNTDGYTAKHQERKPKYTVITEQVEAYIPQKFKKQWSPEQSAGQMKIDLQKTIFHKTIYQFIYANKTRGGKLYKHLLHKNKKYHKQISEILETDFYFANPYHSRKRELNEHMPEQSDKYPWATNGLIRQYFPKKTNFTHISKEEVVTIQEKLNHRPRKILNYRTPYEVFFEEFAKELAA